ncbi:MAG: type II toxin-antitoxin system Phd/YefM family antitoxin [Phycisphaeraceae bacterium]
MKTSEITTFTDHRENLRRDLDRVRATGRPLLVTTNGKPDAVVLSPESYDELLDDAEYTRSVRAIRQSMEEFDQGKGIPAEKVFAKVRKILGLPETQ